MSAIYDNWERLVAAVLRKEQLWQLFHADSMDPSIRSESLAYSSSLKLSSRMSDLAASSWNLQPVSLYQQNQHSAVFSRDVLLRTNEEYEEASFADHQYPGFHSLAFDYETMLFTSAEVVLRRGILETLRKEKFAIHYLSVMDNGITTVVKRLRDAGVSRSIRHKNMAPNEAFFSYEDEMLVIYECQSQGGVLTLLQHGKKKFGMYNLEWESRVRIAIGVARAIANTHSQCNKKLSHGDIKATDEFLSSQNNDYFSDHVLENMAEALIVIPTAGYRIPEVNYDSPSSQESDIYSFGVLLLELLTGAYPMNHNNVVNRMHLVRQVTHKFLEAGTLIVFDFVPVRSASALIEMWKMLLVAMWCLEENPEQRPKSSDVVKMMEEIKRVPPENGN